MSETRKVELGDALYHLRTRISQNPDSMVSVTVNRRDLEALLESVDCPSAGVLSESDAVRRERELIEAKRAGFVYACKIYSAMREPDISQQAARRYPIEKFERPRVARDPHSTYLTWRVVRDAKFLGALSVQVGFDGENWMNYPNEDHSAYPTPARCALWSDLLKSPTELVDADAR